MSVRVLSSGFGYLDGGLGRTLPRMSVSVRSSGPGCLRGGLGPLLTTSSGFTVADNLGLGISQSRAVSPLFGCVACTFLGRALVFVGPVAGIPRPPELGDKYPTGPA